MLIYALALAQATPAPLTETHKRDIGCVALLAIIADEQRRGAIDPSAFPDVRDTGKRWTGIVGERIMNETSQPKEVVAFAMTEAAKAEQNRVKNSAEPATDVSARVTECNALMTAELAAQDRDSAPAPASTSDDPAVVKREKEQLLADMDDPLRISFCAGLVGSAAREIVEREGANSRDAQAFARLNKAFGARLVNLPNVKPDDPDPAMKLAADANAEPEKEAVVARCIRLGESLALALPPE